MSRRPNDDIESQSSSAQNEFRTLFSGPLYLQIIKLPLVIIGTILYIVYYIVNLAFMESIKMISSVVTSFPYLFNRIFHYLILIYDNFPVFARYLSATFYKKILKPIRFFVNNHILPTIYNMIKWTEQKIVSLCVGFYQSIVQPTAKLFYTYLLVRFPKWIDHIFTTLHITIRLLFTTLRFLCLWMSLNILQPFYSFIHTHVFLRFYRTIVSIPWFIYSEVIPATSRFMRRIVYCWLDRLFQYVKTTLPKVVHFIHDSDVLLYRYMLLPLYHAVLTFSLYVINELLKPFSQRMVRMATFVSSNLLRVVSVAILHLSQAIIYSYHTVYWICRQYWLSFYLTFAKIGSFIYNELLPSAGRFIKRMVQVIYCWLGHLILYVKRTLPKAVHFIHGLCDMLYRHMSLHAVFIILCSLCLIYELLKFFSQTIIRMAKFVSFNLLKVVFVTIVRVSQAIIDSYHTVLWICRHYLLSYYRTFAKIGSLIYNELLPSADRFIKRMVQVIYCWLGHLILHIKRTLSKAVHFIHGLCNMLYRHMSLLLYHAVFIILCSLCLMYELLKPLIQRIVWMAKFVSFNLLKVVSVAIIHVSQAIIDSYHTVLWICGHYLVSFYRTFAKIGSFIYNELLPTAGQFIKRMVRIIWCWLDHLMLYVKRTLPKAVHFIHGFCSTLYRDMLLPLYHAVLAFSLYVINEILKPLGQWLIHMRKVVVNASVSGSHAIVHSYHASLFICKEYLLPFCQAIIKMFPLMYNEVVKPVKSQTIYIQRIVRSRFYEFFLQGPAGSSRSNS